MDIERLLDELILREGGFVNDADDPGGATNYGITINTLSAYRRGGASVEDVRKLSQMEARDIYKRNFLTRPRIDQLPEGLIPTVFDMYVNAGTMAVKLLQRTLRKFGADIGVDGVIGPITLAVTTEVFARAGQYLIDAYGIERRNYYYALADKRPASRKYARTRAGGKGGWIKRAEEFISAKYRLTEAAHRARVATWG